jgi:hypothetical protein
LDTMTPSAAGAAAASGTGVDESRDVMAGR